VSDRQRRLRSAHLYLVCADLPDQFLHAVLAGGVDIVQLRMKSAPDARVQETALRFAGVCAQHDALFILNDRPDLAATAGADGVHIGQDDDPVAAARQVVGTERLVGVSTHSRSQIDAAGAAGADYIGVGPVYETPTKPGRPAVGLELLRYAGSHAAVPFFAIGGVSPANVGAVRAAGATRIAVVRSLTEATDPRAAATALRRGLLAEEAGVGSA
jgi:thiamine-phosphate pyrophosphorylase